MNTKSNTPQIIDPASTMPEAIQAIQDDGTFTAAVDQISDELFKELVRLTFTNWNDDEDWDAEDPGTTAIRLYFNDQGQLTGWNYGDVVQNDPDHTWIAEEVQVGRDSFPDCDSEEEALECQEIVFDLAGFDLVSRAEDEELRASYVGGTV